MPDQSPPRRNIELKARDPSPARSLQICRELRARDLGTICQRDTYFDVANGRLKLREEQPGDAHLIRYDRDNRPQQRESRYRIAPVTQPEAVLAVLEGSLGVRARVTKQRRLFVWQQVRIHLDEVDRLGRFIELEAVAPDGSDLAREHELVAHLRERLQIGDALLMPDGYADHLLGRRSAG